MPELRKDPILGRWVIIAPERSRRPLDHALPSPSADSAENCPFCRGHEAQTPPAILTIDQQGNVVAGESDWRVRVVPNAWPALDDSAATPISRNEERDAPPRLTADNGIFESSPGSGVHEVIIEAPQHVTSLSQLDDAQFERILTAWQTRLAQLSERDDLLHVSLFRNDGAAAGASLAHVHSQLLATTFVPPQIEVELHAAADFRKQTGQLLWTHLVNEELSAGVRIVGETELFTVFCPFASRFPAEIWIVPCRARPDFFAAEPDELSELASVLRETLSRLDQAFGRPAFNLAIHTAPFRESRRSAFEWHLEIIPRLTGIAGFELGSGTWINVVAPEDAAACLRDVAL
ncbi:galactose-1-phosphate uridylyltransferase [bacterium]|nr:galactose-1-phosphate uridylyltransferase [bacterium]